MLAENQIVHGLWIGKALSNLELLTIRSFLACGHTFWLWLYEDLETDPPVGTLLQDANTLVPRQHIFRYHAGNQFGHGKGSLAGFSDVFRYKLLYEYGGWWTDMDVTCLRPLDFVTPYVFWSHDVLSVVGNVMKCPPGSILMKECFETAHTAVTAENTDWLKPILILNEGIQRHNLSAFVQPISNADRWEIVQFYFTYPAKPPAHFYVFHWMNEEWRARAGQKPLSFLDQLLQAHSLVAVRVSAPHPITYFLIVLKMRLVPLVPRPVRVVLKSIGRSMMLTFWSLSAWILPFFPRSWKEYVKRAIFN